MSTETRIPMLERRGTEPVKVASPVNRTCGVVVHVARNRDMCI
jgi:hypothetical protein